MKTTMFRKVFAMLMIVMVLVSMFSMNTFAKVAADTEVGTCSGYADADDEAICKAVLALFEDATMKFRTDKSSDVCKYASNVQYFKTGETTPTSVTVYVSKNPSSSDVDVSVDDKGNLIIQGINDNDTSAWNQLFDRFKGVIVGLTGVGTLVMIVLFIIQFMKLGASAGNPQARSQALTGVLWTGVAAALLGSVTIVVGFFYNAL
jgi:hypothetical protein